ncbi:protein COFACTOR ASSEMBLY OF COMPLEX C SUBUNIT B CCB3, chloroplastic-like [Durio zibethinus]|uniref:Protein COFACTOR ASSEMBLY OF COMPLEX C SUBUNIT B CCB3, chloroplastic-like n=1 Tax=Durio zibethinus TaxID=66656 RepID=A0A6P6BDK5_DURZI|nr:protein COFACTOR ASSEMBLY OF COMPLEX C SUBUNIT B CCB3, chloroplastic-like [Durio zibethinus]
MATSSHLLNHVLVKEWQSLVMKKDNSAISERLKCPTRKSSNQNHRVSWCSTYCCLGVTNSNIDLLSSKVTISGEPPYIFGNARNIKLNMQVSPEVTSDLTRRLLLADLDAATAKLAIGILGPFLSAFAFLFILRIVMSWYPKLPVEKFPYVIAYAPTEPFLIATRKLIPPLGGVDVTPVVWFGLVSFLNEILVGPQGLLVLISQQVS